MQNHHPNLGGLQSVHRPLVFHLWAWLLVGFAPLFLVLLGAVLTFDVFRHSPEKTSETVSNALACIGCPGLVLAVLGAVWISEFRKWYATKTAVLKIYEKGFTYESKDQFDDCRWDEIKHLRFRLVPTYSRAFPGMKVKAIRAVVKTDGKVINIADTLNVRKITEIITTAKKNV